MKHFLVFLWILGFSLPGLTVLQGEVDTSQPSSHVRTLSCASSSQGKIKTLQEVGIGDLPKEILAHISSFLPADDFKNYRLACKTFYEASQVSKHPFFLSLLSLTQKSQIISVGADWVTECPQGFHPNNVTSLILPYSSLDPAYLIKALHLLPNLRELNLRGNNLGPAGMQALALALPQLIHLKRLDLSWNFFGPEGMQALVLALPQLIYLEEVNLWGNVIGLEGNEALTQQFPNIRFNF